MEKRNIIAGLLLLSVTVLLGPYMMGSLQEEEGQVAAMTELQESFAQLKETQEALGEPAEGETLTGTSVAAFAAASRRATRAHVNYGFAQFRGDNLRMTHAHGNLLGLLNIVFGLFLGRLAVNKGVRLAISWGLVGGAWLMAGSLFVGNLWWRTALQGIQPGGALFILALYGLLLAIIFKGFAFEGRE